MYARRGIVAASQPLAAQAGIDILALGGSAADAAVATAAALNVTEPTSTGIGGDCFALYYDAESREVSALNGSGRAPSGLTIELLEDQGFGGELPPYHAHTVTVPGACAGWSDLLKRFGRLDLGIALAPAINLAEEGFPVSPLTSHFWRRGAERQLANATGGEELTIDGRGPNAGEIFRNLGLARTFRTVGKGGAQAFYQGEIGESIARAVGDAGGVLSESDLAEHQSTWDEAISITYRGLRVWEAPPNGQGLVALLALKILEGFDLQAQDPLSAARLHLIIEALRVAFADGNWFVADPAFIPAPIEMLLSEGYAERRRTLIDRTQATLSQPVGVPAAASDTVYLSVVDGEGNACSFINSNYLGFGTGIVPRGWGFSLQNRGHGFSLDREHPNALAPGKRPYHTIIPGMVTREDDSLYASFGVMGGFMQPQGHVQVLTGLIDDGLDPQAALDRPRVNLTEARPGSPVALEEGLPEDTVSDLAAMGHETEVITGHMRAMFGRGQVTLKDSESGVLCGGSDPRADGCAIPLA
ncbi:MAG: gamma-glutamyltransferase family protein [Anaerolineales bacterium]